jgi:hypothetical protein
MSRAFVKESEGDEGPELPELQVSPHRNLVTPCGLERIQSRVRALQAALSEAISITQRLRAGEDFAALALQFSDDTGSGQQGGAQHRIPGGGLEQGQAAAGGQGGVGPVLQEQHPGPQLGIGRK